MESKPTRLRIRAWAKKNITFRNVVLIFAPFTIAILIAMLYNLSKTVEHLSVSLIDRTTNTTHDELNDFFNPVIKNLDVSSEWIKNKGNIPLEPKHLNPQFIPLIQNYEQISSMMIADTSGNEYMLLQEDSTWSNRETSSLVNGKNITRYRWKMHNDSLVMVNSWKENKDYDPSSRPWYQEALSMGNSNAWTSPYTFFTTKDPGITASKVCAARTNTFVIAFDVLLMDISRFTTNLHISENGKAFILTSNNLVTGLPPDIRFARTDSLKKYVLNHVDSLKIPELTMAVENWEGHGRKIHEAFSFKSKRQDWWAGFEEFKLNEEEKFFIGVIVPEKDFLAEMNKTRVVIIAGFLLVMTLTLLVIRGYNQKRKAYMLLEEKNQQIEEQKNRIEEQQKEIKDSIKYSKRIQTAILPPDEIFDQSFQDNFILYLPRDIVSGDFYWIQKIKKTTLFCAADCTGHGVPGAFMSIIGHNGLNRATREYKLTKPAEILERLNEIVAETLRQKACGNQEATSTRLKINDGMDIALCSFSPETNTLRYAGAYNPLYLVRKGKAKISFGQNTVEPAIEDDPCSLYEIKATKRPIGSTNTERVFEEHELEILPGDQVFIFSDGFADQFGGHKGKKFMYKPFKKLLLSNYHLPMQEQKQELTKTFKDWKEGYEQVDDIIIISVKF